MNKSDESWRRYGELDPYFAVITDAKFERKNLNDESLKDFFRGGEEYVEALFETLHDHASLASRPLQALEYGCGVGRILIPLAKRCGHVTGADISEGMLKEAEDNCRVRHISNVAFVQAEDALSPARGSFDLIHSFIVFQHIAVARGIKILSRLIDLLSANGVAVLHLMYLRDVSALKNFVDWARATSTIVHSTVNLVKGHPINRPLMQMNAYDLNRVFAVFQQKKCHVLYVDFTNHGGYCGAIFYIQRKTLKLNSTVGLGQIGRI
jgi:2-polyprenyl-3-methyl-5-hydroxy-6-metoxy-1,4-benzoquinol methylase